MLDRREWSTGLSNFKGLQSCSFTRLISIYLSHPVCYGISISHAFLDIFCHFDSNNINAIAYPYCIISAAGRGMYWWLGLLVLSSLDFVQGIGLFGIDFTMQVTQNPNPYLWGPKSLTSKTDSQNQMHISSPNQSVLRTMGIKWKLHTPHMHWQ